VFLYLFQRFGIFTPLYHLLQPWQGNYSVWKKTGESISLMSRIVPVKGITGYADKYDDISRKVKNLFTRNSLLITLLDVNLMTLLNVLMFLCLTGFVTDVVSV